MTIRLKLLFIIVFLISGISYVAAQNNGSIRGVVKDAATNEPLPGANVSIEGTVTGTITNVQGEFLLMNVPSGTHNFVISFIGYESQTIGKKIEPGKTVELNLKLSVSSVGLDEVVVSAQLRGQRAAINQQLNSDALTNVVSADKMKELPDVNAAEAIGRLPGVSVQRSGGEASKVVIRGLSPELTTVTINGVKVPATGSGDRSVDLSMISPELLSNIELFKSPTADMDGDFIGGVVNLGVTRAPDKPVKEVRFYGGYNGLKDEFSNYRGSLNFSHRYLNNKLGFLIKGNYEHTNRSSERINVSWNKDNIDLGQVLVSRLRITDEQKMIQRYGGSSQLDYQYDGGYVMAQALFSGRYTNKYTTLNNIENAGRIFHEPDHSYGTISTFQTLLSGKQRVGIFDAEWRLSRSYTSNNKPYDVSLEIVQYSGVEASAMEETPEALNAKRIEDYSNAQLEKYYFSPNNSKQENLQAAVDLKYDFSIGDNIGGFLKFGGKVSGDKRDFDHDYQQVYWYYLDQAYINRAIDNWPYDMQMTVYDKISLSNFVASGREQPIWNGKYSIYPSFDFSKVDEWHERQKGELDPVYNQEYLKYKAHEKVYAGYAMAKLKLSEVVTFIPGLRYEKSDNNYSGHYSDIDIHGESGQVKDTTSTQRYGEFLPSAHLKIKPAKWFDIRASVAKTLARPNFDMVAPRIRLDLNDGVVYQSNTELQHAVAWNYDFSLAFFSNKLGLLTLGAFYKKFDNFFTKTTRRMSADEAALHGYPKQVYDVEEDYMNFDNSRVYGLEFDLQTHYTILPAHNIVVNLNGTRLWSETYSFTFHPYEVYDPVIRRTVFLADSSFYEKNATDLPNQVDWIANASLGYDYKGFSIRISAIYQAAYLTGFSSRGNSETTKQFYSYVDDHLRFDASISQKIGKHLVIMANAANITGESERRYTWKPKYVTSENRYGATYDLGLRYKF